MNRSNEMRLFGKGGKLLKRVNLNIQKQAVTKEFIEDEREKNIKRALESRSGNMQKILLKAYRSSEFSNFYRSHHPFFYNGTSDSDGNIVLICSNQELKTKNRYILVYSPEGEFICKCTLDIGDLSSVITANVHRMVFSEHGLFLFGAVPDAEDDEGQQERLIKVKLQ